jgi:DNA (cytosine-5)-methyltransferase 1
MRILNGHAGIGGNRALWGSEHEIVAVELDPAIAAVYQELYPDDTVVVADVNEYMLDHYSEFDMIWLSPPCPTHGQYRYNVGVRGKGFRPAIPDMTGLYGAIVFLESHFEGLWAVENVKPYYEPLIQPTVILQRHLVWANFDIAPKAFAPKQVRSKNKISDYDDLGVDLTGTKISNKRQVLRNAVDPELGLHVLLAALDEFSK